MFGLQARLYYLVPSQIYWSCGTGNYINSILIWQEPTQSAWSSLCALQLILHHVVTAMMEKGLYTNAYLGPLCVEFDSLT